jgi:general secretion pathway protein B
MSFLLDALRKAERERQLGQAPSLQAGGPMTAPPARSDRHLRLALGLALVGLVLLSGALLWPRSSAPLADQPAPHSALELAAVDGAGPQSLDELAEPQAALEEVIDETVSMPLEPQDARPPAAATSPPQPEPEALEAEPVAAELAAPTEAPPLQDLPPDYRAQFPALTLEVHVHDPAPERRWIMAGGRRYREGDTLEQGPRIVEITPEGVIFDYQGQRALYPVGR